MDGLLAMRAVASAVAWYNQRLEFSWFIEPSQPFAGVVSTGYSTGYSYDDALYYYSREGLLVSTRNKHDMPDVSLTNSSVFVIFLKPVIGHRNFTVTIVM